MEHIATIISLATTAAGLLGAAATFLIRLIKVCLRKIPDGAEKKAQ